MSFYKRSRYSSSRGGYGAKKFSKCRYCYKSGKFCSHRRTYSGSSPATPWSGYRQKGYSRFKRYKKPGYRKSPKSSSADLEKIDVPVLNADYGEHIDCVPMNGVRLRAVHLTDPKVQLRESKKFSGKVCWRGVTENFEFEMNGDGPFLHRRILFQSTQDWPFKPVLLAKVGCPANVWGRNACCDLLDAEVSGAMKRLFGADITVRSLFFSDVQANGVTVLEDRRHPLEGKKTGVRRSKKYWNGFGRNKKGVVLKYDLTEEGAVTNTLVDGSMGQHIYLLDIFQYGINGLDVKVPDGAGHGRKRHSDDLSKKSSAKRHKSDSSVESNLGDMSMSDYVMTGNPLDDLEGIESWISGVVRVVSKMKLYWYDPK